MKDTLLRSCRFLAMALLMADICACMNLYAVHYHDFWASTPATQIPAIETTAGDPVVYNGKNVDADFLAMVENGYVILGYSSFNATSVAGDASGAMQKAKELKAAVVLTYGKFTHTVSGNIPYTVRNPSETVTTNYSGNISGSGRFATFSGTATTTVPGGHTIYNIPYQVDHFDFLATYWVKRKPPVLGLFTKDLSDDLRRQLQRNRGVVVLAVVKDSPAFNVDILRGDVVIRLGEVEITDIRSMEMAQSKYAGQEIPISLLRNGEPKEILVRLRERPL